MSYVCFSCGKKYSLTEKIFRCTCGGFLEMEENLKFPEEALASRDRSIWRYKEAYGLPRDIVPVSLGEGHTPLISRKIGGDDLCLKLDFLQPTGSFKDRGASLLMSMVKYLGVAEVVEDSSGNAGAAVSAYAAAAGIACRVFVPDYTPDGKLIQMRFYNAEVEKIPGTRQDTNYAAIRASQNTFYASHLWNPVFPLGYKSTAYEIWEDLGKEVPDTVIIPLGGGGNLEGIHLGFTSLLQAGLIDRLPRLVGVQAENCSPLHTAFQEGREDAAEIQVKSTVAEGIAVQKPPRAGAVLKALRESRGRTMAVSEEEILSAAGSLFSLGLYVEPTSAAVLAGWNKLEPEERKSSVLVLTGSGLKETTKLNEIFSPSNPREKKERFSHFDQ